MHIVLQTVGKTNTAGDLERQNSENICKYELPRKLEV